MSARIIALVNQKGGVGKTTTAVSLAAALAQKGQRVLLVDMDPQSNATSAIGATPGEAPGVYDALLDDVAPADCIVQVPEESISLMAASPSLAGAEVELVPILAREQRLANALAAVRGNFDWILIDCPPSLGLLTINALTAADGVIIPVQCEYMALEGLSRLTQTVELVRKSLNAGLFILGVVLTMWDARTRLGQDVIEEVRSHYPQTFVTVIPRAVRLSEAPSHGKSIFRYEPGGRSAAAYDALAGELLSRVGVAA